MSTDSNGGYDNLAEASRREMESTYDVRVGCLNCGFHDVIRIQKGVSVRKSKCPRCECKFGETADE